MRQFTTGCHGNKMGRLCTQTHLYIGILLVFSWTHFEVVNCSAEEYGCARYVLAGGYQFCFDLYEGTKTKVECASLCRQETSGLPIVESAEVNAALQSLVIEHWLLNIWLALEERRHPWHWHDDGQEVDEQGCYQDSQDDPDFPTMVRMDDLTRDTCRRYCAQDNFKYYALQAGDQCWCDDTIGEYDLSDQCITPCAGNGSAMCGGDLVSQVYSLRGTFTFWDDDQPNNHNNYQSCALVDHEGDLFWNDVTCREHHGAICQYPLNEASCIADNLTYVGGSCFSFHRDTGSWYEWNFRCHQNGGHLIHVTNSSQWESIYQYLTTQVWGTSLWIGLVNREWIWFAGERLIYNNWRSSRPNGYDQDCVAMDEHGRWDDVACTLKYSCVCQRDNVTRTSPRPETTTTRRTTTTTPPPPTTTPIPTSPAPTEPSFFDQYIRWALVAGAIIILTIVIAITACACSISRERAKKKREQNAQFNLFFGLDVGDVKSDDPAANFVCPGTPGSVHHVQFAETNGRVPSGSDGHIHLHERS